MANRRQIGVNPRGMREPRTSEEVSRGPHSVISRRARAIGAYDRNLTASYSTAADRKAKELAQGHTYRSSYPYLYNEYRAKEYRKYKQRQKQGGYGPTRADNSLKGLGAEDVIRDPRAMHPDNFVYGNPNDEGFATIGGRPHNGKPTKAKNMPGMKKDTWTRRVNGKTVVCHRRSSGVGRGSGGTLNGASNGRSRRGRSNSHPGIHF